MNLEYEKALDANKILTIFQHEDALIILEMYAETHPEIKHDLQKIINMRKKTRMMFLQKPKKEKLNNALDKFEEIKTVVHQMLKKIEDT